MTIKFNKRWHHHHQHLYHQHTQTILRDTGIPSYTSNCSCIVLVAQGDAVGAGNNSSSSGWLRSRGKKRFAYKVCIHCMHYWLWDYGREAKQDMHTRYAFAYKVCVHCMYYWHHQHEDEDHTLAEYCYFHVHKVNLVQRLWLHMPDTRTLPPGHE